MSICSAETAFEIVAAKGGLLKGSRQLALLHKFVQLPDELALCSAILIVYKCSRWTAFEAFIGTAGSIGDTDDFVPAVDLEDVR